MSRNDVNTSYGTIPGDLNWDLNGNGNTVRGNMTGDLNGTGNTVRGNLRGDLNGTGNTVRGDLHGDLNGTGNVILGNLYGDNLGGGNTVRGSKIKSKLKTFSDSKGKYSFSFGGGIINHGVVGVRTDEPGSVAINHWDGSTEIISKDGSTSTRVMGNVFNIGRGNPAVETAYINQRATSPPPAKRVLCEDFPEEPEAEWMDDTRDKGTCLLCMDLVGVFSVQCRDSLHPKSLCYRCAKTYAEKTEALCPWCNTEMRGLHKFKIIESQENKD